jgi:hypothetical protein
LKVDAKNRQVIEIFIDVGQLMGNGTSVKENLNIRMCKRFKKNISYTFIDKEKKKCYFLVGTTKL